MLGCGTGGLPGSRSTSCAEAAGKATATVERELRRISIAWKAGSKCMAQRQVGKEVDE